MHNSYGYETYRGRSGVKIVLTVLAVILLVVLLLAVAFFFFAQQYIVYDDEGKAHLEFPFFRQEEEVLPTLLPAQPTPLVVVTPPPTPEPTPTPQPFLDPVELPVSALLDGTAPELTAAAGGSAAVFTMKPVSGQLAYVSDLKTAIEAEASAAEPGLNDAIRAGCGGELYTIARVSCFKDDTGPKYFPYLSGVNLYTQIGNWRDNDLHRWFSPASDQARDYLAGICAELAGLGFDEIWLDWCTFPTRGSLSRIVRGDAYNDDTLERDLDGFYAAVRAALEPYPQVKLGITVSRGLLTGKADASGQTAEQLSAYADRLYLAAPAQDETYPGLESLGFSGGQLVYTGGSGPVGTGRLIVPES